MRIANLSQQFCVSIKPWAWHMLPSVISIAEPDAHWHRGMCLLIRTAAAIPPPRFGYHPPFPTPSLLGLTRLLLHSATTPTSVSVCVERGSRARYRLVLSIVVLLLISIRQYIPQQYTFMLLRCFCCYCCFAYTVLVIKATTMTFWTVKWIKVNEPFIYGNGSSGCTHP
jgi:hypothetical protein